VKPPLTPGLRRRRRQIKQQVQAALDATALALRAQLRAERAVAAADQRWNRAFTKLLRFDSKHAGRK
jgi:hypothetical protein